MSFQDIKLQDDAIRILKRSVEKDMLAPGLLFFGRRGTGKSLTAVTLAKTLNCAVKGPSDSCDGCASCRKIESGNHPDVHMIKPEGPGNMIKIEKMKNLHRSIILKPFEGRTKLYIIEEAHLLNDESENSILKILEEPPKDSVIILITDSPDRIFATLKSRCQWIRFSQAPPDDLKEALVKEYNLKEKDAHFLSRLSQGSLGKALAMKEEGTLDWKNDVLDRFSRDAIVLREDSFFFGKKRIETLDFVDVLISWYRDILILQSGADAALIINIDRIEDIRMNAQAITRDKLNEILGEALAMRSHIEQNVNPKLALGNFALTAEI